MSERRAGVIATAAERPRESFDAASPAGVSWFTLFSGDLTSTDRMSAGLMELEPGDAGLKPHRHTHPEIYYVASGSGLLCVDGVETVLTAGAAAFIHGDAEHSLRNTGDAVLRIFYVFPADRFSDIVYRFPPYAAE